MSHHSENEKFKLVYHGGCGEIVEKKSRFIASVSPANSEEEAIAFIESIKKQYWDARHNCHAFVIGQNNEITRCSDDGEPSGTAGKPMLDVLLGQGLHNTVVVVTRYFGGTLLGTGGLVRAYQKSVQEGLAQSTIIEKTAGFLMNIGTDYTGIGKLQYIASTMGLYIIDTQYSDVVNVQLLTESNLKNAFITKFTEATNGKCKIGEPQDCFFSLIENKPFIFDN